MGTTLGTVLPSNNDSPNVTTPVFYREFTIEMYVQFNYATPLLTSSIFTFQKYELRFDSAILNLSYGSIKQITTTLPPNNVWSLIALSSSSASQNMALINVIYYNNVVTQNLAYVALTVPTDYKITLRKDANTATKISYSYIRLWSKPMSPMTIMYYNGAFFSDYQSNLLIDYWDFRILRSQTLVKNKILLNNTSNLSATIGTSNSYYITCGTSTYLNNSNTLKGLFCDKKLLFLLNSQATVAAPVSNNNASQLSLSAYTMEVWLKIDTTSMISPNINPIIGANGT